MYFVEFARLLRAAVLCLSLVSCAQQKQDRTQLLVVVNSNFAPETELASVALSVDGEERARVAIKADGTPAIPFSFGVLPPAGDTRAQVIVQAQALSADAVPLACPARARVGFAAGEARVLQLELTHACGTGECACGDAQTCLQGVCIAYDVDISTLASVEPGQELEGLKVSPSTLLPAPERPSCNADNGAWSDIGRAVSRNHDGALCPLMSTGHEWGVAANPLDMNKQALVDYVDRNLEVEHDILTLHVVWLDDEARVSGVYAFDPDELETPTLRDALALPAVRSAQQPLQLVVREEQLSRAKLVEALPRVLLDSGVVKACRPIYLTASGDASFAALRQLRESIRTQPRWSALWNLVHFQRRIAAVMPDAVRAEMTETAAAGFERVALDSQRTDLPFLRRSARSLGLPTELYDAGAPSQVASLCDGSSSVAQRLFVERPREVRFIDELRYQVSSARTLIALDVVGLEAGARTLDYQGFPDLSITRSVSLHSEQQPGLVIGDTDTLWGDTGAVLRFSAASKQQLPLHDATFNVERPELGYFAWPSQILMVTARLDTSVLPKGARQVLVSKRRGESGWALQYVNDGGGSALQYTWYGRGREDGVVRAITAAISVDTLPMQTQAPFTIYAADNRIAIDDRMQERLVTTPTMSPPSQHVLITNDVPITLGADPDGGAYFDGDIQSVRILSMYSGSALL